MYDTFYKTHWRAGFLILWMGVLAFVLGGDPYVFVFMYLVCSFTTSAPSFPSFSFSPFPFHQFSFSLLFLLSLPSPSPPSLDAHISVLLLQLPSAVWLWGVVFLNPGSLPSSVHEEQWKRLLNINMQVHTRTHIRTQTTNSNTFVLSHILTLTLIGDQRNCEKALSVRPHPAKPPWRKCSDTNSWKCHANIVQVC